MRRAPLASAASSALVSACGHDGLGTGRRAARRPTAARVHRRRAAAAGPVRRASIDEAVKLALEQNLGLQVSGSIRRSRTRTSPRRYALGAELFTGSCAQISNSQSTTDSFCGQPPDFSTDQLARQRRRRPDPALAAATMRSTGTASRFDDQQPSLDTSTRSSARNLDVQVHAAAAAQLRDRQDPPADAQSARRTARSADMRAPQQRRRRTVARRQERLLGPRRARIDNLEGAAESLELSRADARRQPEARRDRHDGANRHRRRPRPKWRATRRA